MKRILSLAMAFLCVFALVGCGKEEAKVPNVPVKDIVSAIEGEVNLDGLMDLDLSNKEMDELTKGMIEGYGINPEDVEEGIIRCAMINLDARELVILKAKEESKLPELQAALEKRVENQLAAFENYVPQNHEMVKNHVLKTNGNYIILAISEDVEKIDEIFENTLK
ncbi:DUF4358 domain-containing protein [Oceanirhabdus sp. W0125-5]|uniref:DUF4358 domain-containing protein n=1 Tax=Oceanirhabdus sp. W0125-5 TaxID=2999116 RepID=UPI0022F2C94A|nr:DUF4358 domain-containing protein [Oceanirhabdus sp. W0125-5]WBW99017.1 DUF4358 domain-containing protein [Oceanirhabdus sp. W0125-5]